MFDSNLFLMLKILKVILIIFPFFYLTELSSEIIVNLSKKLIRTVRKKGSNPSLNTKSSFYIH